MDNGQLLQIGVLLFSSLAAASLVFTLAWPYLSGEKQTEKRVSGVVEGRAALAARRTAADQGAQRKKSVSDTLKSIEEQQKKSKNVSLLTRLRRAGLNVSPKVFIAANVICGLVFFAGAYISAPGLPLIALVILAAVGGIGFPRWVLSYLIKRRQAKFGDELANAIDVIVRGVKSGLPLNECLGIIARESQEPLASEFQEVVDAQRAGVPLNECFERLCLRMPLPEVRFFTIVISIQQSSGGSLSEALSNLSGVLRARKQLVAKVGALSAEAKASAYVLGSLPFVVTGMVHMINPLYLEPLWTLPIGQLLLGGAILLMLIGILVMKKMINFKY